MARMIGGLTLCVMGLGLLLLMVIRVLEPGLVLSLLGFSLAFAGLVISIGGLLESLNR